MLAETLSSGNVGPFLVTAQQSLKNVTDVLENSLVPELLEISDQVLMPSCWGILNKLGESLSSGNGECMLGILKVFY